MSGTSLDGATPSVASSETVAPPPNGSAGEPQGSTPASEVTSAPDPAKPEGHEPDKQSRREARAHAANRREIRELHRELGYMRAMLEQRAPQGQPAEGEPAPPQRQTRSSQDEAQAELTRSIFESIADMGEEYEAVVEKITADDFPGTVTMRDFLATSDKAAEVAKLLADDPKEARRISLLSDWAQRRAMERLEARTSAKPAPKTTQAPPPVPTVGGRSVANFDPEKASMDEYAAHWQARQAKR